jgi:hypothetical protein
MLDCYPRAGGTSTEILYEDDTLTTAYQRGEFRKTSVALSADATSKTVRVDIGAAAGTFPGALTDRSWIVRIHPPTDWPKNLQPVVRLKGKETDWPIRKLDRNAEAMPLGDAAGAPDGDVFEVRVPSAPVSQRQTLEISFATAH